MKCSHQWHQFNLPMIASSPPVHHATSVISMWSPFLKFHALAIPVLWSSEIIANLSLLCSLDTYLCLQQGYFVQTLDQSHYLVMGNCDVGRYTHSTTDIIYLSNSWSLYHNVAEDHPHIVCRACFVQLNRITALGLRLECASNISRSWRRSRAAQGQAGDDKKATSDPLCSVQPCTALAWCYH